MLRIPQFEVIAGTTLKLTWTNSGVTPSALSLCLRSNEETLVSSVTPVASGNGHYFAPLFVPSSDPYYIAESIAIIDASTYVNRAIVKAQKLEVN